MRPEKYFYNLDVYMRRELLAEETYYKEDGRPEQDHVQCGRRQHRLGKVKSL